jgi:hypothetical protein
MFPLFISKDPPMTHFYKKARDFLGPVNYKAKNNNIIASLQPTVTPYFY